MVSAEVVAVVVVLREGDDLFHTSSCSVLVHSYPGGRWISERMTISFSVLLLSA